MPQASQANRALMKANVLKMVADLLDNDTVVITSKRGKNTIDVGDGTLHYEPNDTYTLTIDVNGGASDYDDVSLYDQMTRHHQVNVAK